jgi:hypothetical protein
MQQHPDDVSLNNNRRMVLNFGERPEEDESSSPHSNMYPPPGLNNQPANEAISINSK